MDQLERLTRIRSRRHLARELGYTLRNFTSVIYATPEDQRYLQFSINKKGGGERIILAPNEKLKEVQRRLTRLLYLCVEDLETEQLNRTKVSHGFHKKRGILTNASAHRNRRYVFNIDLHNFFGSINFGRIVGFLEKDTAFQLPSEVAKTIAHIACHQGVLPQGSPCSPVISNLIGHVFDVRMLRLAKRAKCRYTRYVDDITFSTNSREFPTTIARKSIEQPNSWLPSDQLSNAITRAGFTINSKKTRMQIQGSRQQVTGLIVNDVINVPREYYTQTRAMTHRLLSSGTYEIPKQDGPIDNLHPLEGRLSHIYQVRKHRSPEPESTTKAEPDKQTAFEKLYADFLFYKYFIAPDKPIVLTEGPSDVIYLKSAIRERREKFGSLVDVKTGELKVKFAHINERSRHILKITPGTKGIGDTILKHRQMTKRFKTSTKSVTIFLVDNDKAAQDTVFGIARELAKKAGKTCPKISIGSDDIPYHLGQNSYFLKVPHGGTKSKMLIEDLLPTEWLDKEIDGKKLDLKKPHGDHSSLGKVAFAKSIIQANAHEIDFSGFDPLLALFSDTIAMFDANGQQDT